MPPEAVAVSFEIADDEAFKSIVDQGQTWAEPNFAHSVHLETTKLSPGRDYWYRFHVADVTSPIGHTRTAPAAHQTADKLRFAFASCQQYEQGYYGAYRHMAKEDLRLSNSPWRRYLRVFSGENKVRSHESPEPITLDDHLSALRPL